MIVQHRLEGMADALLLGGQAKVEILVEVLAQLAQDHLNILDLLAVQLDERQLTLLRLVPQLVVDVLLGGGKWRQQSKANQGVRGLIECYQQDYRKRWPKQTLTSY